MDDLSRRKLTLKDEIVMFFFCPNNKTGGVVFDLWQNSPIQLMVNTQSVVGGHMSTQFSPGGGRYRQTSGSVF